MTYWLMKTEPDGFSVADLGAAPRRTTMWDGVRNYQARNMLRDQMKREDRVFIYHSSCDQPGIFGIAEVVREGYPDPTAFQRGHVHFDADSDAQDPRWFAVDVRLERALKKPVFLDELRKHADGPLAGMLLLRRGNRLSITPVEARHWKFIVALAET
jgi:predicted RNA-binding protein with PUA-like domain